jgi:hypothetical protein
VELTPAGYRLTLAADEVDAVAFGQLLNGGAYDRALSLWRGEPDLPGHPEEGARS